MNIVKKIYRYFRLLAQRRLPGYFIIEQYKLYVKYIISGGTAATTDLGLLFIFTELLDIWYLLSAILAFSIAFFVSFYLQKFWTFRDTDIKKLKQQAGLYLLVALINLVVNTGGMFLLVDKLEMWYIFAQIIMGALIAFSSFIIYNFFIFTEKKKVPNGKRILITTGIYPPDIGGPATYVSALERELPKHEFKVKIVTYGDAKKTENVFSISRKQNVLFRYLKYVWQVWKLLYWADIVYTQGLVSEGYPTYLACKLRRKKYVLKIVGDYAWEQMQQRVGQDFITPDDFQNKKFNFKTELHRRIEHRVAQRAAKIIVPSNYLKKIVSQWGVDSEKIKVVYNSINFKDVEPKKKTENEKWIISVGRLVPWKGMDTLIEIMPELLKSINNLKLIIIGDGPEYEALQIKSRKFAPPASPDLQRGESNDLGSKVENRIKLLGKLSHDEVLSYLQASDAFVLNTGYEGLPHTTLEAMHTGVPVITTNIGGNPEVVENNNTGILIEYNNKEQIKNAILKLLSDKNLSDKLVSNAKANLNKFDKERMINNTINILTS